MIVFVVWGQPDSSWHLCVTLGNTTDGVVETSGSWIMAAGSAQNFVLIAKHGRFAATPVRREDHLRQRHPQRRDPAQRRHILSSDNNASNKFRPVSWLCDNNMRRQNREDEIPAHRQVRRDQRRRNPAQPFSIFIGGGEMMTDTNREMDSPNKIGSTCLAQPSTATFSPSAASITSTNRCRAMAPATATPRPARPCPSAPSPNTTTLPPSFPKAIDCHGTRHRRRDSVHYGDQESADHLLSTRPSRACYSATRPSSKTATSSEATCCGNDAPNKILSNKQSRRYGDYLTRGSDDIIGGETAHIEQPEVDDVAVDMTDAAQESGHGQVSKHEHTLQWTDVTPLLQSVSLTEL